jgi:hypothetical protein
MLAQRQRTASNNHQRLLKTGRRVVFGVTAQQSAKISLMPRYFNFSNRASLMIPLQPRYLRSQPHVTFAVAFLLQRQRTHLQNNPSCSGFFVPGSWLIF